MSTVAYTWKKTYTGTSADGLAYTWLTVNKDDGRFIVTLWEETHSTPWDPPDCQPVKEQVFLSLPAAQAWAEAEDLSQYADQLHWESILAENLAQEQQS